MLTFMRSTIAAIIVSLAIAFSQAAHPDAADDVYLRCKGEVSIFRVSGMQIVEKQEIVAHIKNGKINFSAKWVASWREYSNMHPI